MCMNEFRINMGFGPSFGLWPSSFSVLVLDHCLVISCSKIGQKSAKTKFLQNICANVKMTNNYVGLGRLVILILNSCHYQG